MLYSLDFLRIVDELDRLIQRFSHHKKDLGHGHRGTFSHNNQLLYGLFDEVAKVIAKGRIDNLSTLETKHIFGIIEGLDKAPKGIGAFD